MKKILTIMTAAAVLLAGLIFTSCGAKEIIKETVDGSYKQWYKYKSNRQIDIPVLQSTADDNQADESTDKIKNAEIYFYYDKDIGLKVAIQASKEEQITLYNGLFSTRQELTIGSVKQYTPQEFGKVKWSALWGSGKLEKTNEPKIVAKPSECIVLGEGTNPKIQWKKFLTNYLLDKLLED